MNRQERNEHEAVCPRCGAAAVWFYLDPEKSRVEIMCSDCGRYTLSREEFDLAEAETTEHSEAESG